MQSIDVLVLDLGGVYLDVDWTLTIESLCRDYPHVRPDVVQTMAHWPPYDKLERGQLDHDEFIKLLGEELGIQWTQDEFLKYWNSCVKGLDLQVHQVVQKVHLPVYGLSNTNFFHIEHEVRKYAELKELKKLFVSYELGCRKPEPEIFEKVAGEIGTPPERILFIDDLEDNVQAAKASGFQARKCFLSAECLKKSLREFGVSL